MYKNRSKGLALLNTSSRSGFTLIELLVVIAIIGILSSVVLVSLNSARSKGNDAATKSNLSAILTQSEIYYGGAGNNTYGNAQNGCTANTGTLWSDITIARSVTATEITNGPGIVVCNSTPQAYAVSSALQVNIGANTNTFWCVDSTGNAKAHQSPLGNGVTCP